MKIDELQDKTQNVNINLEIIELGEIRDWARGDYSGQVRTATCKDIYGFECSLSLWHEDVNKFKVGDKVKLINGYCSFYDDPEKGLKKQLTSGKFGKVELINGEKNDKI